MSEISGSSEEQHGKEVAITTVVQGTAAAKIMQTLRDVSQPDEDAGELGLMLSTIAMGLERALGDELERAQPTGELDEFVAALTRWIAGHRSDSARRLVVVELPHHPEHQPLPNGTRLHLLDEAERLAEHASRPL